MRDLPQPSPQSTLEELELLVAQRQQILCTLSDQLQIPLEFSIEECYPISIETSHRALFQQTSNYAELFIVKLQSGVLSESATATLEPFTN